MKVFLALSVLLCPSLAWQFSANLQLDEYGELYNQTEVFDPMTGDVITHVPSHQRNGSLFHDVTKIENENLGITVWKLKDQDVCFLEDLDPETHPSRFMLEVAHLEAQNVTLHVAEIRTVYIQAVDDGEWEGDRNSLTEDMASLCEGLPIRRIHEVVIDDSAVHMRRVYWEPVIHCVCGHARSSLRSTNSTPEIIHVIVSS